MVEAMPPGVQRFLEWLPRAEPMGGVEPMLLQYRSWLEAGGAGEAESGAAIGEIVRFMKQGHEAWAPLFDRIYTSATPGFRTRPSALLVEVARSRPPGRALDVCAGEGRNGVWLAEQGWEVTGFDVSAAGITAARRHADDAGATARFVQEVALDFDYASEQWDLVAIFYAPVPLTDPEYVERITGAMAPGAQLVIESFASDDSARQRRPVDIDPEALRAAVVGCEVERLDDLVDRPDWIDRPERIVRMVARKPVPVTIQRS